MLLCAMSATAVAAADRGIGRNFQQFIGVLSHRYGNEIIPILVELNVVRIVISTKIEFKHAIAPNPLASLIHTIMNRMKQNHNLQMNILCKEKQ